MVRKNILGAYFHAILRVDEDDAGICYVKGCDGVSYEVVGARTVDYIEFLAKEFGVKMVENTE